MSKTKPTCQHSKYHQSDFEASTPVQVHHCWETLFSINSFPSFSFGSLIPWCLIPERESAFKNVCLHQAPTKIIRYRRLDQQRFIIVSVSGHTNYSKRNVLLFGQETLKVVGRLWSTTERHWTGAKENGWQVPCTHLGMKKYAQTIMITTFLVCILHQQENSKFVFK